MPTIDELKYLRAEMRSCEACDLRHEYGVVVPCAGSPEARVMFIGEAPGEEEVEQVKPFVGRSGKMLRNAIEEAGLDLSKVLISNTILCRPQNNSFPTDRALINGCVDRWISRELQLFRPKIVVAVGGKPHSHVRESSEGITRACGRWEQWKVPENKFGVKDLEVWYMPILHPSFCMRPGNRDSDNPIMAMDRSEKIALFNTHVAQIVAKLEETDG